MMRGVKPFPSLLAAALGLLLAAPAFAEQPVTFDGSSQIGVYGSFIDYGAGSVIAMDDSIALGLELRHGLWGGVMTYGIGGAFHYMPQDLSAGEPLLGAFLAYPGISGFSWESGGGRLFDPWLSVSLGRMAAREPTGLLFLDETAVQPEQLMDGLDVSFRSHGFFAEAEAGFLGLLDKRINRIVFTPQDVAELDDLVTYAAPPRGLAVLRLEVEDLFLAQSLGLFGIWQKDFRPSTPAFDSWYIGLAARGPIVAGLSHSTDVIVSINVPTPGDVGAGLLLSEELSYALDLGPLRSVWLSARWGSGDGGGLAAFPALAGPPVSTSFAEPLVGLVRLELGLDAGFTVPPADAELAAQLAARLLLTPDGTFPAGYDFLPAGPYIGTEVELAVSYVPLLGLRVDANGGILITAQSVLPFLILSAGVEL